MKTLKERIEEFIEEDINPSLSFHGGFLEIKDYDAEAGILSVIMGGGCQGCASSKQTMLYAIDQMLKDEFEEIQTIVDVTDHAAGAQPYYT